MKFLLLILCAYLTLHLNNMCSWLFDKTQLVDNSLSNLSSQSKDDLLNDKIMHNG